MCSRRKQKRVFQQQSRTSIPPETLPDEIYDGYKYDYNQNYMTNTNEELSSTPRGDIRPKYF